MTSAAMIVISGFNAAGQPSLASKVSAYYPFPLLSPDTAGEASPVAGSNQGTSPDCGSAALDSLIASCRTQLASDTSVIVNSPAGDPNLWPQLCQVCRETGARLIPIVAQSDSLGSLDFPHHEIDVCQDPNAILSVAVTIIDTALDLWEAVDCGDDSNAGA